MAPTIPPLSDAETNDTISNDYAECTEWLELEKRHTAVLQTLFDDWHLNHNYPMHMRIDEADFEVSLYHNRVQIIHHLGSQLVWGDHPHLCIFGHVSCSIQHWATNRVLKEMESDVQKLVRLFGDGLHVKFDQYGGGWGLVVEPSPYFDFCLELQQVALSHFADDEHDELQDFHVSLYIACTDQAIEAWNAYLSKGGWRYFD